MVACTVAVGPVLQTAILCCFLMLAELLLAGRWHRASCLMNQGSGGRAGCGEGWWELTEAAFQAGWAGLGSQRHRWGLPRAELCRLLSGR